MHPMISDEIRKFLAEAGRKGGLKSRRSLTPEQAKTMVTAREAKRAKNLQGAPTVSDSTERAQDPKESPSR